jgi:hypothetical protein
MDCSEKRGAIKAISALVYGGMLGAEGHDVDPFIQQMFNKLTQLLLEAHQDYDANC